MREFIVGICFYFIAANTINPAYNVIFPDVKHGLTLLCRYLFIRCRFSLANDDSLLVRIVKESRDEENEEVAVKVNR